VPGAEYVVAFSAGALSFVSPCVLPLVPVYLSVTTGLGVEELSGAGRGTAGKVLRGAGLFILGFSAVFIALGLSATAVGAVLLRHQSGITRGAGVVVVVMSALILAGTTRRGLLWREWRFHPAGARAGGLWAPPLTGAAFAFGWTPCIGPVLGSVLAIAAAQDGLLRGAGLLATYSAGLAVPLLATGLAFHRAVGPLSWTRRHSTALTRTMGTVLAAYGVLLLLDRLSWLTGALQTGLGSPG
jgi:cytochrome c-type biogenesis protein